METSTHLANRYISVGVIVKLSVWKVPERLAATLTHRNDRRLALVLC